MARNVRFYFRSGVELAIPSGDRPRLRSGRGGGRQMRTFEPFAVNFETTAEEAEKIVSAWRVLDIQLDPDRVSQHLAALKHWNKGLNPTRGRRHYGYKLEQAKIQKTF